jgi:hypothetical protein
MNDRIVHARAAYQLAREEYQRWARIEDALTDSERREKAKADARVDAAYAAYNRARGVK